jgi:ubiquinone/menaquinone biosynthesis C-methylase UbiE
VTLPTWSFCSVRSITLTDRADRLRSLHEVARVLKPGGWLFAAGISRFASALDGLLLVHSMAGRPHIHDERPRVQLVITGAWGRC